jgi:hypothetical protein
VKSTKACSVASCTRTLHALGYCSLHYRRFRNGKSLLNPIQKQRKHNSTKIRNDQGKKQCVGCEEWFSESYFRYHHLTADRLDVRCKECDTFMRIKRMYKISKTDIEQFLKKQKGCAICHKSENLFPIWWAVDHDHKCCSGIESCGNCIRGILCSNCNRGLGQFKDSEKILINAIGYIKDRKTKK